MKWYICLLAGLALALSATASLGGWMLRIHQGTTVEERALADIDSLTVYDAIGSCCSPDFTCTVTTETACSGIWTLNGVCTPNPCSTPSGMVRVPPGTFTMGSPPDEPGRTGNETQHQVILTRAIYVSTHEVTQTEWQAVMGWNDSSFPGANRPVEGVTWFDAVSYCNQRSTVDGLTSVYTLNGVVYNGNHIANAGVTWNQAANGYRLLTEAEWEYACRAGSTTAFCNGGITYLDCSPVDPNLGLVGWYCGNASGATHDTGGKAANAWGLLDVHGNVYEWCWDWYADYSGNVTDPTGPDFGTGRVERGGSWDSAVGTARRCRSAFRGAVEPSYRGNYLGVRLARTAL